MPKTTPEAKAARRDEILEAARRCFSRFGYEGATVTRLEQETGLSRGAIFNYFANKQEIFLALAHRENERLSRIWLDDGFTALLRSILAEDPDWLGVFVESARRLRTDAAFRKRWEERDPELDRRLSERLEELQAAGELRDDVSAETLGRFMGAVTDGLVTRLAAGFGPPPAVDELLSLVDQAIRPAAARTAA